MEKYICPACQVPVPPEAHSDAQKARYCTNCGLPVSMLCPYEEVSDPYATRLMLLNDRRQAPAACTDAKCGGLLKVCPVCGRLHKLQDTTCHTATCKQRAQPPELVESSLPFSSSRGPLDGTRTVKCRGHFTSQAPQSLHTQTIADAEHLAFRYGLLTVASGRSLTAYHWNGSQWQQRGNPLPLSSSSARVVSLLLDDGDAFVLTTEGWYIVSLDTIALKDQLPEICTLQAKRGLWWARVSKDGDAGNARLLIANRSEETTRAVALPVPAAKIEDMVIGDKIYLACANGSILSVKPENGPALEQEMHCAWSRLALVDDRLIALGYNQANNITLAAMQAGQFEGPHHHNATYLPDMAIVNEEVYLSSADAIATYRLPYLSQQPTTMQISKNEQTETGMLAICDDAGEVRLLLHRSNNGSRHSLYLVDPKRGTQMPLGVLMLSPPCVCVADERLVITWREPSGTKMSTFVLGEEAK